MELIQEGRVWKFEDNINTDLIFPNRAMRLPEAEQARLVFSANRPDWVEQVLPGDIIIAGLNFGMGSGRPVGKLLQACGIQGLAAESVNGLCLRNCINYNLPALSCRGVSELFEEGQLARIDYISGQVTNLSTGRTLQGVGLPGLLLEILQAGGVIPMLIREGYIEARSFVANGSFDEG